METNKSVNLLAELNKINPVGSQQMKTKLELGSERVKKWILWIASILFVILFLLAGLHKFIMPLPDALRYTALVIACLTMLLPNIAMLIDIVVGVLQIIRFKTESFRLLVLEFQHDKSNVESITIFDRKVLEEVKEWLLIKCSRIKGRINLFFGNPEKIALFSLVGFGWMAYKEVFSEKVPENISSVANDPFHFVLLIGVALLTGISIGAMFLNQQLRRYSYNIEIIEMALRVKQKIANQ